MATVRSLHGKKLAIQEVIVQEVDLALAAYPKGFRQLLSNRKIDTAEKAEKYLKDEGSQYDPFLLDGMEAAVSRIADAIEKKQRITVYGDYDVDGISGTALLVTVLARLGAQVDAYFPDRFEEGYGVNTQALRELAEKKADLVITVDCGIRSANEVDAANRLGLDMIVSDHHYPGDLVPQALAVINPKKPGDLYPDKDLSGAGVAFKIAEAVTKKVSSPHVCANDFLDLVALGTVADIVPLLGENRALVKAGIKRMQQSPNLGLRALAGAASINISQVKARDIGYMLAPRLNAAGRIASARIAYDLLMTDDPGIAGKLAQQLDDLNRQRQGMVISMVKNAQAEIQASDCKNILFSFREDYMQGVVGLVASRLTEDYYRPTIVGQIRGDVAVASCRSIPEFHITQNLDKCAELLEKHGGHAMAAGFTIKVERIEELKTCLGALCDEALNEQDIVPSLRADYDIPLRSIPKDILEKIGQLEPTGQENPEAVFFSRGVQVVAKRCVGANNLHLSLRVRDGQSEYPAIAFRMGDLMDKIQDRVDLVYTMNRNEYNGSVTTQLNIIDIINTSGMK